jgi:co-chaperonin GroES (HSP10)
MTKEQVIAIAELLEEQAVGFNILVLQATPSLKTKGGIDKPQEVIDREAKEAKSSRLIVLSVGTGVTESIEVGDRVRATQVANFNGSFESPIDGYEIKLIRQHDIMTVSKI